MDDRREKQLQYELESDAVAASAKLQEKMTAAEDGDPNASRAVRLIARAYQVVSDELEVQRSAKCTGLGAKYRAWLRALPLDIASVIAIRECISICSSHTHKRAVVVQDLAISIGKLWEMEVRIREAELVNPMYMQKIHEQVKERCTTSPSHLRRLYNTAYERVMKGEINSDLSKSDLLQVGKFGVEACIQAGIIESERGVGAKGSVVAFSLTPEVSEYLHGYTLQDVAGVMDKAAGAMLCPPDDWTNAWDGGYLTPRRKFARPLVDLRRVRASERASMRQNFTAENMPTVFEAANYMQSVAFEIHEPTLKAIRNVWDAGGGVLGVPKKLPPRDPMCPMPPEWDKENATDAETEVFTAWKRARVLYFDNLREWRGHVREIGGFIKIAKQVKGPIWFPMFCDTRGRWYYSGTPNPQGSDMAKAVLRFHKKKALGPDGLFWLKVVIANHSGFDKERFVDRARWTDQNWPRIAAALDAPEDHAEALGHDAPWCLFSAAWELREALSCPDPTLYETNLPGHMDATCSGLQHFSACLRDPVGGHFVNLVDETNTGPKQDIYMKVATSALAAMQRDAEGDDLELREKALWWISKGLPRGLAKKPVKSWRAIKSVNSGNTQTGQS